MAPWIKVQTQPPFGYATHLMLNWYKQPNTTYTVTIDSNVTDFYGNACCRSRMSCPLRPATSRPSCRLTSTALRTTACSRRRMGVRYRNVDAIDAKLYRLPLVDLFQLAGENSWSVWDNYVVPDQAQNLIWERNYTPEGGDNVIERLGVKLTACKAAAARGEALPPGVYLLEVRDPTAPGVGRFLRSVADHHFQLQPHLQTCVAGR